MKHIKQYSDYLSEKVNDALSLRAENIDKTLKYSEHLVSPSTSPSKNIELFEQTDYHQSYKKNKTSNDFWKYKL